MAKTLFIQSAFDLIKGDLDNAVQNLNSFIEEKGFILKNQKIEKNAKPEYALIPEYNTQSYSEYYYNKNKEAICLHFFHSSDKTFNIVMHDYKNAKTFTAGHTALQKPFCFKNLGNIERRKIEKEDLKFSYGFDFKR